MSNGQKEKLKILSSILGDYTKSGKEWLFYCKECGHHKKKLSVNLEKNKFKCWICDYAGNNLRRLVRHYGNASQRQEWDKFDNCVDLSDNIELNFEEEAQDNEIQIELPKQFVSLCNGPINNMSSKTALSYLKKRGIQEKEILQWHMGYCSSGPFEGRIIIPSFNSDGNLNYFIARDYTGTNYSKYMNPEASKNIIFNDLYLNFKDDIILVEGVFDAIVAGTNAVPLLGSTMNENNNLFKKIIGNDSKVFIALDPDALEKENKIIELLLKYDIEIYKIDIEPFKDLGEMSKEEFPRRKENAQLLNNDNFLLYRALNI